MAGRLPLLHRKGSHPHSCLASLRHPRRGAWDSIPPTPRRSHSPRRPIFWVAAAVVVVVIVVIVAVAAGNNTKNKGLATQTTLASPGSTGSTGNSGSNSGSTGNSGTTTTTQPAQEPIGTSASITDNGAPDYDVTVTQFVDPAQPADTFVTPDNAGDRFVAAAFTIKSTGTTVVSDDIYNDAKLYDSSGQGFEGNFEAPTNGPTFPSGEIDAAPGGTASGWVMYEVPGSATGFTLTFTPSSGFATQAATTWSVGN